MSSATLSTEMQSTPSHDAETLPPSQTAQEYIAAQLSLEADAREALPYQFDTCTKPLGALRQSIYACLTCTPPPASPYQQFTPAGVCYSCSISCHGEHTLVELFAKRNFECDCGTTRFETSGTACALRSNGSSGRKGDVKGEPARKDNEYNQNYAGRFCGCGEEYDPEKEKGTMFQCIGLGTLADGGCGEDWWHPECLMGLPRKQAELQDKSQSNHASGDKPGAAGPNSNDDENTDEIDDAPRGFPHEDDFEYLICYKCTSAFPWIKQYSGTTGFLPAVPAAASPTIAGRVESDVPEASCIEETKPVKRKAEDEIDTSTDIKRVRVEATNDADAARAESTIVVAVEGSDNALRTHSVADAPTAPKHTTLPPPPPEDEKINLFLRDDFREHFCRCPECFPRLAKHAQLLEAEDTYEPPVSEDGADDDNQSLVGRSVHSGSIYDRGEAALSSVDRVRAIEGVMAYNHLRDKVKAFLQPFANSGQAVGAEDVKAYFAKLRGDEQAMRDAAVAAGSSNGDVKGDGRREQGGY